MTAVLIMARAPRPGTAKTRLEPLLGQDGCARLQAELIRNTAGWAARSAARVWLAFTPHDAGAEYARLIPRQVDLFPQVEGDLGARLRSATDRIFRDYAGPLSVIGTDAPLLGPRQLRAAVRAVVEGSDACLVPAFDGGYALITLARHTPAAFDLPADAWGGPDVLELTLGALQADGRTNRVLAPVRDLDTPADALALRANPSCPAALRPLLASETTSA